MASYNGPIIKQELLRPPSIMMQAMGKRINIKKSDVFGTGFISAINKILKSVNMPEDNFYRLKSPKVLMSSENLAEPVVRTKKEHRSVRGQGTTKKREPQRATEVYEDVEVKKVESKAVKLQYTKSETPMKYEPLEVIPQYDENSDHYEEDKRQTIARYDVIKIGQSIGGRSQSWTLLLTKIPLPIYDHKPIEKLYDKYLRNKYQKKQGLEILSRINI